MKKIIIIIFAFISAISFHISLNHMKDEYFLDLTILPSKQKDASFYLFYHDASLEEELILDEIKALSMQYDVSVVKSELQAAQQITETSILTNDPDLFIDSGLRLNNKQLQLFQTSSELLLSNQPSVSAAYYFPIFPSSDVVNVYGFSHMYQTGVDGMFEFYGEHAKTVVEELHQKFPTLEISNMDADYSFDRDVLDAPQMPFFYRLLIMLTIIAAVSLLIVYANQERNLAIQKMHGYTNLKMMWKENAKLLFAIIFVSVLVYLALLVGYCPQWNQYVVQLIYSLSKFIVLECAALAVIFTCLYIYFNKVSVVSLLKHKQKENGLLLLNFILRFVCVIVGISIFSEQMPKFVSNMQFLFAYQDYAEQFEDRHTIYYSGNFESSDHYPFDLYDELNAQNGIGVDATQYKYAAEYPDAFITIPYIDVNEHYLDHYKTFEQSNFSFEPGKEYYIMHHDTYEKYKEQLHEQLGATREAILFVDYDYQVFVYDREVNEGGMGYIKNPITHVTTFLNPSNVYLDVNTFDLDQVIANMQAKGYRSNFSLYSALEEDQFNAEVAKQESMIQFTLIVISLSTLVLIMVQLVMLFMKTQAKELAVKKTMGFHFYKRYEDLFVMQSLFYCMITLYGLYKGFQLLQYVIILFLFLFEVAATALFVHLQERKVVYHVLKE